MNKLSSLVDKKLWLAPLAGYTDFAFRKLAKECGADVCVSELVSADGLIYNSQKTFSYMVFEPSMRPFGMQLFGSDPAVMAKATQIALQLKPDFIDINMGCPVKKVIKRGAGAALMTNTENAVAIVKAMLQVIDGRVPLSAKIRSGWDVPSINAIPFAQQLQTAGLDFICLHARTRSQMYAGKADIGLIKELKVNLDIPVIANGDIVDKESAQAMYDVTACDSIMIGRAALGKPWIFRQIKSADEAVEPSAAHKFAIIKKHLDYMIADKGIDVAIKELRSHVCFYTKGYPGGAMIRNEINHVNTIESVLDALKRLYEKNK